MLRKFLHALWVWTKTALFLSVLFCVLLLFWWVDHMPSTCL